MTAVRAQGAAGELAKGSARMPSRLAGSAAGRARFACSAVLLSADLLAFVLAQAASWEAAKALEAFFWPGTPLQPRMGLPIDAVLLAGVVLCFAGQGHYSRRVPFWTELRTVVFASAAALAGCGFLLFSLQLHDSRLLVVLSWVLFAAAVPSLRAAARSVLAACRLWQLRVVVVGGQAAARRAAGALRSEPGLGYEVAAVVPHTPHTASHPGMWQELLRRHRAALLVLAQPDDEELVDSLLRDRVPLALMARTGLPVQGMAQTSFISHETVLFTCPDNLARPLARAAKVAFDVVAAALLLLIALPALLLIAAVVSLDGGPVLYAHRRVGADGRMFGCLKFRSMVPDADEVLQRLLRSDPAAAAEWAATQKLRHDPRITPIGRLLRSTSMDELPQLLNVLRLEMSLVGPRPIVPAEVPRYGDMIAYYYATRPGLTGLWQVSGRSETGYGERVSLDAWYVKNWSMWHDLAILARTVPAVLRRQGAH